MGEDPNENPQRFLDGVEKACMALGCLSVRWVEMVSFQLNGKAEEWWNTWRKNGARDAPPIDWEEFGREFIERFLPRTV